MRPGQRRRLFLMLQVSVKGAFNHAYVDRTLARANDWYRMLSGIYATEKSIAPWQLSSTACGPDQAARTPLVDPRSDLPRARWGRHSLPGLKFSFATEDRASDKVGTWTSTWTRSSGECIGSVASTSGVRDVCVMRIGFVRCPFCGMSFSYDQVVCLPWPAAAWVVARPEARLAKDRGVRWTKAIDLEFAASIEGRPVHRGLRLHGSRRPRCVLAASFLVSISCSRSTFCAQSVYSAKVVAGVLTTDVK